jgi:glycosyltransferase involved in cell wall biosynthesis
MNKELFSVAIPAFNEEDRIENVIKNYLKFSSDIIIIDKFSSDRTVEICNKYNVVVVNYPSGIDETEQTLMVNKIAKNDWVLYTACSEIAPLELLNEFEKIVQISTEFKFKAAVFNRISYTGGVITHDLSNYYTNFKNGIFARFINKKYFDYRNARIHCEIPVLASIDEIYIIESTISMKHIRNDDLASSELKHSRYADIESKSMVELNIKGSFYRLFARTIYNFFKIYRMNYKVGFPGFVISISHALYVFQVELRLLCYKYNFTRDVIIKKNTLLKDELYFSIFKE